MDDQVVSNAGLVRDPHKSGVRRFREGGDTVVTQWILLNPGEP